MLFAPALTDRVILPSARGGRYFFNRIGQKLPFTFFVVGASLLAKSFIALFASEQRLGVPLAPKKM